MLDTARLHELHVSFWKSFVLVEVLRHVFLTTFVAMCLTIWDCVWYERPVHGPQTSCASLVVVILQQPDLWV